MYSDAGPSNSARYIEMNDIASDSDEGSEIKIELSVEDNSLTEDDMWTFPSAVTPKHNQLHRPPSLADDYEVIGGVPAFVWKHLKIHEQANMVNKEFQGGMFAFSFDGTRMVLRESQKLICIYDVKDNFSLIAKKEIECNSWVQCLAFWGHKNDSLVLCYDNMAAVYSIARSLDSFQRHQGSERISTEGLTLSGIQRIVVEDPHVDNYRFKLISLELITLICTWSIVPTDKLDIYFLENASEELRHTRLQLSKLVVNPFVCFSKDGRKCMVTDSFVPKSSQKLQPESSLSLYDGEKAHTQIFNKIGSKKLNVIKSSSFIAEIGLCLCNSKALYATKHIGGPLQNWINVYSIRTKKPSRAMYSLKLENYVIDVQAHFLDSYPSCLEKKQTASRNVSMIAFLVTYPTKIVFVIWNYSLNVILKEAKLETDEIKCHEDTQITYCMSPNAKWIAVGSSTDEIVGLFSTITCSLIWKINLQSESGLDQDSNSLRFDPSGTRLIVSTKEALYMFAPSCLLENCRIDFVCLTYELDFRSTLSFLELSHEQQKLITKNFLWRLLNLHQSESKLRDGLEQVDIANSTTLSNVALLLKDNCRLFILYGSLKSVFTAWYMMSSVQEIDEYEMPNDIVKSQVLEDFTNQCNSSNDLLNLHIFLHPILHPGKESVAVFCIKDRRVLAIFIDPKKKRMQFVVNFHEEDDWHSNLCQSQDGRYVYVIGHNKIMIIDLKQKSATNAQYEIDLQDWFTKNIHEKEIRQYSISLDGKAILVGWNKEEGQRVILTSTTNQKKLNDKKNHKEAIIDCWTLSDDFAKVAFINYNKVDNVISSICVYNIKNQKLKEYGEDDLNPHAKRVLKNVSKYSNIELVFDELRGTLWVIVMPDQNKPGRKLFWIPIGPYSMRNCIQSLKMRDFPKERPNSKELNSLVDTFGIAFFNMTFNEQTNFRIVVDTKDESLLLEFLSISSKQNITFEHSCNQCSNGKGSSGLLKMFIESKEEELVRFFLDLINNKKVEFEVIAKMMNECFNDLWKDYHAWMKPMIQKDGLIWNFGELSIPLDFFLRKDLQKFLVGTTNSMIKWRLARDENRIDSVWKAVNKILVRGIEGKCSPTTTKAILNFVCIDHVCKIGLKGILRNLLMQNAPSYIYKSTLVKGVIDWKWEYIWKNRSKWNLVVYTSFSTIFSSYAICLGYVGRDFYHTLWIRIFLSCLLFFAMSFAFWFLLKEHIQLRTYIKDGKELFPKNLSWGFKQYVRSTWNIVEIITYVMLLTVIPLLHILSTFRANAMPFFICIVAAEVLLLWLKVRFCYLLASRKTIVVCSFGTMPKHLTAQIFLSLAWIVLVGFGFALFTILQYCVDNDQEQNDDVDDEIESSFRTPQKAILTLFFAMVGTFEPEIYYHCQGLTPVVVALFAGYVSLQLIVMLNMLIAIMGDTFDKVKDTEVEQLLLGRARFIDACEASLTAKQIKKLEEKMGGYLYILTPTKDNIDIRDTLWKGRVRTLEERVNIKIEEAHKTAVQEMETCVQKYSETFEKGMQERIVKGEQKIHQELQLEIRNMSQEFRSTMSEFRSKLDIIKDKLEKTDSQ